MTEHLLVLILSICLISVVAANQITDYVVARRAVTARDRTIDECSVAAEACDTAKHTGAPCSSCAGAGARVRALKGNP